MLCYNCFHDAPEGARHCPYCGHSLGEENPKDTLPVGSILNGRYIVGRALGQGGFGITYKAYDYKTRDIVALKEYYPDTICGRTGNGVTVAPSNRDDQDFTWGRTHFLQEAQTLANLSHVHGIAHVHEFFEENGTTYFSMDYVEGQDLRHWVASRGGSVSWDELRGIVYPVMEALEVVHETHLIHRDIAPDNICVTKSGGVLLDFGAARVSMGERSQSLSVVLKNGYAPKEQYYKKGHQGPWTDVYAMGATIYRCLTGVVPPESLERSEALAQGRADPLRPIDSYTAVDPRVTAAVTKAMSVEAKDRFQTMGDFERALSEGEPQPVGKVRLEDAYVVLYADGDLVFQGGASYDPARRILNAGRFEASHIWWSAKRDQNDNKNGDEWLHRVRRVSSDSAIVASDSLNSLFSGCYNLSDISGLSKWDVSSVRDMSHLFEGCSRLSNVSALSSWQASSLTDISRAFAGCLSLGDLSPLAQWHVSPSIDQRDAFEGCPAIPPAWYRVKKPEVPHEPATPAPPTSTKEAYQQKLKQAESEKLGMRWYKFVIYVQCLASAIFDFMAGLVYVVSRWGNITEFVYIVYPAMQVVDVTYGIALFALGALFIYVRFQLKLFTANGRKLYLAVWLASAIASGLYLLLASDVRGAFISTSDNIIELVIGIVACVCNFRYFQRRKHLFDR